MNCTDKLMSKKDYGYVMKQIDYAIKMSWYDEIANDYASGFLLKEDTLKNAFYFHVRTRLETLFQMFHIRMYTEYNEGVLKPNKMRADLAIVELNPQSDAFYLGDRVEQVLALIELKFDTSADYIRTDVEKVKRYKKLTALDGCQYYLGFLTECMYSKRQYWLDKRQTNNWAGGCVTELDARRYDDYRGGEMAFSICSYNSYNPALNTKDVADMHFVPFI